MQVCGAQSLHVTARVNNDGNDVLQKVFSDDLSYEEPLGGRMAEEQAPDVYCLGCQSLTTGLGFFYLPVQYCPYSLECDFSWQWSCQ